MTQRAVTILGSTGSVGRNTLDLIERAPDRYRVEALTANSRVDALIDQARRFKARFAAIGDARQRRALEDGLAGTGIAVGAGPAAVREAAQRPADWVMAAIVGAAGLAPTLEAVRRGAVVALANKECLVCAGGLFMAQVAAAKATLLPVDSEHNAIFQVFDAERREGIERIILTASGGPFRTLERAAMADVTPAQAVAHPNWSMGAKISVDSATMMNKGLEIIEAHHLFALDEGRIDVVVHPQSVVHSLVAYRDGSVLAQLGTPDMRTPIAYCLGWPERIATPSERLNLAKVASLTFEAPDHERFPALTLAREALRRGRGAPTLLNAANEIAVAAFLAGRIGFLGIVEVVSDVLATVPDPRPATLEDVDALDAAARRAASLFVERRSRNSSVA
jgi:1-deoxy-D-xylulose-5-phosphate reductoisomerase